MLLCEQTIWPSYHLAAFDGRLLAALPVAGVPAHWIDTGGEIKQVVRVPHGETVPPHRGADVFTELVEEKLSSWVSLRQTVSMWTDGGRPHESS